MDTFLWLISHFSARIAVCVLGVLDAFGLFFFYDKGRLMPFVKDNIPLLLSLTSVTILVSLIFAYWGGKAGYDYKYMGRSRRWEYINTDFSRMDNTFMNIMYWACKFALFPVIIVLFILLITEVVYLIPELKFYIK